MTAISESDAMALQVTDVTKHYDSGFTLDDVTFDLPKGYIMGLIGPNGAGKSTLIKLILNMIHRDAGSIHVLGLDNIANEDPSKNNSAWCSTSATCMNCGKSRTLNVLSRHCIHHGTVDAITSIWILLALVTHRTARNISRIFPAVCR